MKPSVRRQAASRRRVTSLNKTAIEPMKSLRTSLRLLMEFTDEQPAFGGGVLAERTGLSKSHVSKALAAFVEAGLLKQDPETRAFSVGLRAFVLGARFANYDRLSREAMPILRDLTQRTGHSTRLSVMDGGQALYMLGVEGPLFLDSGWHAGTRVPLHSTTAGRVMLAFMDAGQAEKMLAAAELGRLTEHTITDRTAIRRIVARTRARGYDVQRGETTVGLGTLGVPIFGAGQAILGVLGVAFPTHVIGARDEVRFLDHLHRAARILSLRMGSAVYPFGGAITSVRRDERSRPRSSPSSK